MSLDEGMMKDDRDEPITIEWLFASGLRALYSDGEKSPAFKDAKIKWNQFEGVHMDVVDVTVAFRKVNTRGRLLHLLQAFGIEVKS